MDYKLNSGETFEGGKGFQTKFPRLFRLDSDE